MSSIPIHRQTKVKADLDCDVALGVIEKVLANTVNLWCSQMHFMPKKDGMSRRMVYFGPLNRATFHQTYVTESPLVQVSWIPANSFMSCADTWNAYYSTQLDLESSLSWVAIGI